MTMTEEEQKQLKETIRAMAPMIGIDPEDMEKIFGGAEEVQKGMGRLRNQVRVLTVWASHHDKDGLMEAREVVRNAEKAEGTPN